VFEAKIIPPAIAQTELERFKFIEIFWQAELGRGEICERRAIAQNRSTEEAILRSQPDGFGFRPRLPAVRTKTASTKCPPVQTAIPEGAE
jgi:hypothetical protein